MSKRGEKRITLASSLGLATVGQLTSQFLEKRGAPIRVDASKVEHVGGLGAQVLISAKSTWDADAVPFTVSKPSEAFVADLSLLGVAEKFELAKD